MVHEVDVCWCPGDETGCTTGCLAKIGRVWWKSWICKMFVILPWLLHAFVLAIWLSDAAMIIEQQLHDLQLWRQGDFMRQGSAQRLAEPQPRFLLRFKKGVLEAACFFDQFCILEILERRSVPVGRARHLSFPFWNLSCFVPKSAGCGENLVDRPFLSVQVFQ